MNRVLICGKDLYNAGYKEGPLYLMLMQVVLKGRIDNAIKSDTKQAELQYLWSKGILPINIVK